jgi:hypothetical protein
MALADHSHDHNHAAGAPHPAQAAPWSLLRMAMPMRLGMAALIAIALWAFVLLAMR